MPVLKITISVALAVWVALAGAAHAQAQPPRDLTYVAGRRLALVVGIDNYPKSPLQNARNDAQAMAAMLRELGFTVTLLQDIPRSQMVSTVSSFGELLRPEDVGFFFYAGHGLQIDGENYLVPADFDAASSAAARLNTMPVSEVQTAFSKAKVSVLVLDACRNNPFSNTRSGGRGLAPVEARGNIIAFATGAGQLASDNPLAGNGLFTQQLLTTLREPNLPLREVFYRVRQRVYNATNGQQFPAVYDGLLGEVVLRSDGTGVVGPPVVVAPTVSPVLPPAAPAPAKTSIGTSAAAVPGEAVFELSHLHNTVSSFGLIPGALKVANGYLRWSEPGGKDDFAVPCAEVDEISAKPRGTMADKTGIYRRKNISYLESGYVRVRGKRYDFLMVIDGPPESRPSATAYVDAVLAVCPAVKIKQ